MGTEAVNGLTGGETENPNVSNGLAGFACSPPPAREQIWLPDKTRCQPQGSPVVSAAGKWVNRRDSRVPLQIDRGDTSPQHRFEVEPEAEALLASYDAFIEASGEKAKALRAI